MNLERLENNSGLLWVAFNQDATCFACGLKDGFSIYTADPLRQRERYQFENGGGIGCVEMLFFSNYLGLVGGGSLPQFPRNRVILWDDLHKKAEFELDTSHLAVVQNDRVLAVKLRRDSIVLVLEQTVQVYSMGKPVTLLWEFESALNPKGICALCADNQNAILAFPIKFRPNVSSRRHSKAKCEGIVGLINLGKGQRQREHPSIHTEGDGVRMNASDSFFQQHGARIDAHETTLTCIALTTDGKRLATSSHKGTLIRIWDTKSYQTVFELRRGTTSVNMYNLAFNKDGSLLCCGSDAGTIHVFRLQTPRGASGRRHGAASQNVFAAVADNIGLTQSGSNSQITSFQRIKVPHSSHDIPYICAFSSGVIEPNVAVICLTGAGAWYRFAFDETAIRGTHAQPVTTYQRFLDMTDHI